jgi:hypothetical protein
MVSVYSPRRKSHKIVMIGDSHVRNSTAELQQKPRRAHCDVPSFIKPGAGVDTTVNAVRDEIKD